MTARGSWKRTEREVAARLGGKRVPVSGRARGDVPDIAHPLFAVEVKHTSRMPALLLKAMAQAKAAVRGEQVPLVVLHEAGKRHTGDFVVLRLEDFEGLCGELKGGGDE